MNDGPKIKECSHQGYLVIIEQEVLDIALPMKSVLDPNERPRIKTIARTKVVQCFRCEQFFNLAMSAEKVANKLKDAAENPVKEN